MLGTTGPTYLRDETWLMARALPAHSYVKLTPL